jgi:hypothetical protein
MKKDVNVKELLNSEMGQKMTLGAKIFKIKNQDIFCLGEFGGKIRSNGIAFIIGDKKGLKKQAIRVIRNPKKNTKTGWIPVEYKDKILCLRKQSTKGFFKQVFEWVVGEIIGVNSNNEIIIKIIDKETSPFPNLKEYPDLMNAGLMKLESDKTLPVYMKCFQTIPVNNWTGFRLIDKFENSNNKNKPKYKLKHIEENIIEDLVYSPRIKNIVAEFNFSDSENVNIIYHVVDVNIDEREILNIVKSYEFSLNEKNFKTSEMLFSTRNILKLKSIVNEYGIELIESKSKLNSYAMMMRLK